VSLTRTLIRVLIRRVSDRWLTVVRVRVRVRVGVRVRFTVTVFWPMRIVEEPVAEIYWRYGGDTGEIWARHGRDIGEICTVGRGLRCAHGPAIQAAELVGDGGLGHLLHGRDVEQLRMELAELGGDGASERGQG